MSDGEITPNRSASARDALAGELARQQQMDPRLIEEELEATDFARQCARAWEEDERQRKEQEELDEQQAAEQARQDTVDHIAVEVLEVVGSITAGAMSTWETEGGKPVGSSLTSVAGIAGKVVSAVNPESRLLRVAGRSAKVMLHSNIAMLTRHLLKGGTS